MADHPRPGRKAFLPIDEEELDEAADRVALAKNIPTLTPPVRRTSQQLPEPGAQPQLAFGVPQRAKGEGASATPSNPLTSAAPKPDDATTRSGFTQVRVRCPVYLSDQLTLEQQQLRREGQRVTLNYIVLRALQKAGYHIDEADLSEDGRRLRR